MKAATSGGDRLLASLVFIHNGFSPTLLFFLAGALDLVGSARLEVYLIPGFLIGGVFFSLLGSVGGLIRHGILYGLATFLLMYVALVVLVYNYKTLLPVEGVLYSFLATSFCFPFITVAGIRAIPQFFQTRRAIKAAIMGISPLVISLGLAVIYVAMAQSGIQEVMLIFLALLIALSGVAAILAGRPVTGKGSAEA